MDHRRIVRVRLQFATEQERRRNQNRFQRELDALLETLAVRVGQREQLHQAVHFFLHHRPAKSARGKSGDDLAGDFGFRPGRGLAEEDALVRLGQNRRLGRVGILDFEVVDDQVAVAIFGVRVFRIAIIIQIRRGEFVRACRDVDAHLVNLRRRFLGRHVKLFQFLVVKTE